MKSDNTKFDRIPYWIWSSLALLAALSVGATLFALTHLIAILALLALVGIAVVARRCDVQGLTGIFLLLIPLQWLVIALLQVSGVSQYELISAMKEVVLVATVIWFAYRAPGVRLTLPDIILGAMLMLVVIEQLFYTDIKAMRDDWEWALPYMLGRVLPLDAAMQAKWAKCAVWMCAVLSIVGGAEVLFLGPGFRLFLLSVVEGDLTLPPPFLADGYSGLRAASTMVSPLSFSALCMIALVLWWTYMNNPIPAAIIATGLVLTVTRSAFIATIAALLVIGIRRREPARTAMLIAFVAAAIAIAIPSLDLYRYLGNTFSPGADASLVGHADSVSAGIDRMLEYPMGTGAGTASPRKLASNASAFDIESTYLSFAVEYGMVVGVLFVGFIVFTLWRILRVKKPIGYAAFSILLGFSFLIAVGPLHQDITLGCWVWVPVGIAITSSCEDLHLKPLQAMPLTS